MKGRYEKLIFRPGVGIKIYKLLLDCLRHLLYNYYNTNGLIAIAFTRTPRHNNLSKERLLCLSFFYPGSRLFRMIQLK